MDAGALKPARGTDVAGMLMSVPTRRMNRRQNPIEDVHKTRYSLTGLEIETPTASADVCVHAHRW